MAFALGPLVSVLCFSLGVHASPRQAATHKLKDRSTFLAADSSGAPIFPWTEGTHHPSTRLMCGITEEVGAHTDKYEDCPSSCPYFAQNRKDLDHCTFLCVAAADCGEWNPNKPIPDEIKKSKTCRGPKVNFCSQPHLDGTDTCQVCQRGFEEHDGHCYFAHWTGIIVVGLIFAVVFVFIIVWVVDLCCRESVEGGDDAVHKAEAWRSQSKIIDREGTSRTIYDTFTTNLCSHNVAGPGMMLHFNFQMFFILWPLACGLVWVVLALFHNELFIMGTRRFGTPRHNCILVAWGYETQQRLMWTKVVFLAIVYVGSFVSFLLFSVRQLRIYEQINAAEKTMKDFALELKGLPALPGKEADLEKALQLAVEAAIDKKIVGVSIAWNYHEDQDNIDALCSLDLARSGLAYAMEEANKKKPTEEEVDAALKEEAEKVAKTEPDLNAVHKWMYNVEKKYLGPDEEEEGTEEEKAAKVKGMLEKMVSSESAFVVFHTEEDKDAVLEAAKKVIFDAEKYGFGKEEELTLEPVANEPANVNWHNFDHPGNGGKMILGFLKGFFKVYVPAMLVWFFLFYVPYAYSLYTFNYDNGAELPGYYSIIFTIVICGGNATMYVVCDVCCDIIGFRYKDTKQVTYMLMYLCACMINVFLDMIVTYYTAMKVMVGLDFRTYHGRRLADIDTFTEQFETYAMQRSLGENVYRYAWPSTFFLCFVLEPFVTIMIPYQIGKLVIRTHSEIRGSCAEAYLMAFEFDLGRYADILLNVFLGILIFFFPGGYIWTLFFAMAFSHGFIYCFDHWRVINVIPYVKIVSMEVDWWAQVAMCGCCGVILGCLVFKANCEEYSGYCSQDMSLIVKTFAAGTLHFIVHFLLLVYLVPKLTKEVKDENPGMTFKTVAAKEARTWFSVNPVHCLRSKYIHNHSPHCRLAYFGKEHLLQVNADIGCHFFDKAAEVEEYDAKKSMTAFARQSMTAMTGKKEAA